MSSTSRWQLVRHDRYINTAQLNILPGSTVHAEVTGILNNFGGIYRVSSGPALSSDTTPIISSNAGVVGVTLNYTDGESKIVISGADGSYALRFPYGWSGTVTPFKPDFSFLLVIFDYENVLMDLIGQDFEAKTWLFLPQVRR